MPYHLDTLGFQDITGIVDPVLLIYIPKQFPNP